MKTNNEPGSSSPVEPVDNWWEDADERVVLSNPQVLLTCLANSSSPELVGKPMEIGRDWIGGRTVHEGDQKKWRWDVPNDYDIKQDIRRKKTWTHGPFYKRDKRLVLSERIDGACVFIAARADDPWVQIRMDLSSGLNPGTTYQIFGFWQKSVNDSFRRDAAKVCLACHHSIFPDEAMPISSWSQKSREFVWPIAYSMGIETDYQPTAQMQKKLLAKYKL